MTTIFALIKDMNYISSNLYGSHIVLYCGFGTEALWCFGRSYKYGSVWYTSNQVNTWTSLLEILVNSKTWITKT